MARRIRWAHLLQLKAGAAWPVLAAGDELEMRRPVTALALDKKAQVQLAALVDALEGVVVREVA